MATVASAAVAATVTADTPLLEIYVPGQETYNTPDKKNYALLNPKAPPPAFIEDGAVTRQCASLTYAIPLVDRAAIENAQQTGRSVAQARHVWQFEQTRWAAQAKRVNGSLARRTVEPVGPRPTGGGDVAPRGRGDAAPQPSSTGSPGSPPRITASGLMSMLGIKRPTAPAPSAPPTPSGHVLGTQPSDIRAFMPDFDKLKQQVDHNQAVLIAQDERLKGQEQQYAKALTDALGQGLDRLSAAGQPVPLAQLNDFEMFRAYQVEQCIAARSLPDPGTRARLDALFDRYQPLARASIAASRAEVLRTLEAANSSAAYRATWASHFGTPWLSGIAEKDPDLARSATARLNALVAQEQRAVEEAERRAAAEVARQAALLKKRNLDNAARNVAPTEEEVTKLATTYYMENTASAGEIGGLRRTSDNTFEHQVDNLFFGRQRIFNAVVKANELRCQPRGKVQFCSAKINKAAYRLREGQPDREMFNSTDVFEAEYQWSADGLQAAVLKEEIGRMIRVSGGGGGGGSSRASDRERDDFNRELGRRGAAMSGDSYGGQSNKELRREFGYGK